MQKRRIWKITWTNSEVNIEFEDVEIIKSEGLCEDRAFEREYKNLVWYLLPPSAELSIYFGIYIIVNGVVHGVFISESW